MKDIVAFRTKLADIATARFEWGECDCCLFAADLVHELTGIDFAEPFRGKYSTRREAETIIAEYGGLRTLITSVVGKEPVDPALALAGDPVFGQAGGIEAIGIRVRRFVIFKALHGVVEYPAEKCICAWNL